MATQSTGAGVNLQDLEGAILLLDGGLGTSLEDLYAVKFDSSTPLWSSHLLMSDPGTLQNLQVEFSKAGADILLTATYQASHQGFALTLRNRMSTHDAHAKAVEYMRSSVDIARRSHVLSGRTYGLIALSLGAYGATTVPSTEYSGQYDREHDCQEALYNFHLNRMKVFADYDETWSKIDIVAFETLPRFDEVKAVREVMKTLEACNNTKKELGSMGLKPYWISCVFPNASLKLPDDTSIEELCKTMMSDDLPTPFAIGINCTKLHLLRPIVTLFSSAFRDAKFPRIHLVIYPDGANDLIYNTETRDWEAADTSEPSEPKVTTSRSWDDELYQIVRELQHQHGDVWRGIIVGGCCKTTPDMIRKLRRRVDGQHPD